MFRIDRTCHESWQPYFQSQRSLLDSITEKLNSDIFDGVAIHPKPDQVLRVFEMAVSDIRVVILGQDPYPTPGDAMGYSFVIDDRVAPVPASLRNILKELTSDLGTQIKVDPTLDSWRSQGVFLLNRVLTVQSGTPGSHRGFGWEEFTRGALRYLLESNPHVVAILWGREAQGLRELFPPAQCVVSAHPSPLSAYRGFFGSKPFSRCNDILARLGREPIDWR